VAIYEKPSLNLAIRVRISLVVISIMFSLLILRLWYLQIVKGDYFRNLSENNRIRSVYVQAPRGMIYDRWGETLVANRPAFNIELVTEDCPDEKRVIEKLEKLIGVTPGSINKNNPLSRKRKPFEPKLLIKDASRDTVAKVAVNKFHLPGISIEATPARDYVYKESASHLLGYIREITKDQLSGVKYKGYQQGEVVGQFGLESNLEDMLRGVRGLQRVEVNAMGTRISEFSFEEERMGNDVYLTIDAAVQAAAENGLAGLKGAAVALDPNSGEILALASLPAFDPNIFTGEISTDAWRELSAGRTSKLTNRVLQSAYPPGSVFKIITALAGLSEKVISQYETVYCPGYYSFAGRRYRCHKHVGHGWVDLRSAIVESCDTYFYSLATKLGIDTIHKYSTDFGLGMPTGLALGQESKGLIPSTEWKRQYFSKAEDKIWYPGETLSVVIGQGAIMTTPIQMARSLAALVNGGKLIRPQAVRKISGEDGHAIQEFIPEILSQSTLNANAVKIIRDALIGVVNDKKGTGGRAKLEKFPEILVAGKTGTAQVVSLDVTAKGDHLKDHAWFASYAPADKPELVVVVFVENGGHGGAAAAPIAKAIFEAYFESVKSHKVKLVPHNIEGSINRS